MKQLVKTSLHICWVFPTLNSFFSQYWLACHHNYQKYNKYSFKTATESCRANTCCWSVLIRAGVDMAAKQTLMCLVRSKNRRCFCPIGNRLLSVSSCQRREVFTVLDHILGWDPPDPCWLNVVPMYIEPKKSQRYISKFVSHHWVPLWSLQNIGDIAALSSVEPIVHPSK